MKHKHSAWCLPVTLIFGFIVVVIFFGLTFTLIWNLFMAAV